MSFSNSLRNQSKVSVLFSKELARTKFIWLVEFWMKRNLFLKERSTKQSDCFGRRLEDAFLLAFMSKRISKSNGILLLRNTRHFEGKSTAWWIHQCSAELLKGTKSASVIQSQALQALCQPKVNNKQSLLHHWHWMTIKAQEEPKEKGLHGQGKD